MRTFLAILVGVVVSSLVPGRALAQVAEDKGILALDNYVYLRIRVPAAGFGIRDRRVLLEQRLVHILSYENTEMPKVRIGDVRGKPTIYVDDVKFVTVYPQDAKANNTSMKALAEVWAKRIYAGIRMNGPGFGRPARLPTAAPPDESIPERPDYIPSGP
ncbi:MAG: hypothetical protein ACE5O2_06800 [Armatimonadota bacterium]